ncbi:MAG: ABC transporter [Lysobacterales bacterium 69-70]|nr:ATP-binding cassette domain-containing protein [Xanthomonadaceae bacterium]ODU36138.1 MAG: ABC transporter [Xanthomonadaceae bacterium SCN 69-320]ODV18118.1 MAG: ABC transporter [Xanthomonadaceae bacterium SCN 69-25]OJY99403.1 MAG: ABC transporter [Xanthomonadales bacterium 69-70]
MITMNSVYKSFGSVAALGGLQFIAQDGRITGLLGPNGAGKTTALRILFGLLRADRGEIAIDGVDPARDPLAARRRLGIVTDQVGLYPRLTTREHLDYFGRLHGLDRKAIASATQDIVTRLALEDIIDRRTAGFSQGQRMKVALARALLHKPRNLLLDEPSRGLDVASARALRTALIRLRGDGCCIVLASHVMQEVSQLCDEVAVIAGGRSVARGSVAELCARSGRQHLEDAFVALTGTEEGIAA